MNTFSLLLAFVSFSQNKYTTIKAKSECIVYFWCWGFYFYAIGNTEMERDELMLFKMRSTKSVGVYFSLVFLLFDLAVPVFI